ncbi:MAG: type II toxin-antitoxin system VapC family toxin [Thermoproteota archaeon]
MRIIDADILSYALYNDSPAHDPAWNFLEKAISGELEVYLTYTTILETYNVLFWYYRVRPLRKLLKKLKLTVSALKVVESSINGLEISSAENILLGDGFLIATALAHRIPIIVSNDQDIANKASKYGLIVENPIPEEIRKKLMKYEAQR